jgi:hypothetical protein
MALVVIAVAGVIAGDMGFHVNLAATTLAAVVIVYLFCRGIGWIIAGFGGD